MAIIDCKVNKQFTYKGVIFDKGNIFPFDTERRRDIGLKRAGFIEEFPVDCYDYVPKISIQITNELTLKPLVKIEDITVFEDKKSIEPYLLLYKLVSRGRIIKSLKEEFKGNCLDSHEFSNFTEDDLAKHNNCKYKEFSILAFKCGYETKSKTTPIDIKWCKKITEYIQDINKEG